MCKYVFLSFTLPHLHMFFPINLIHLVHIIRFIFKFYIDLDISLLHSLNFIFSIFFNLQICFPLNFHYYPQLGHLQMQCTQLWVLFLLQHFVCELSIFFIFFLKLTFIKNWSTNGNVNKINKMISFCFNTSSYFNGVQQIVCT